MFDMKTMLSSKSNRLSVDANDLLSSSQMEEIKAGGVDKPILELCSDGCTVCVSCAVCTSCVTLVL